MRKKQVISEYELKIAELKSVRDQEAARVQEQIDLRIKEEFKLKDIRKNYALLERTYLSVQNDCDLCHQEIENLEAYNQKLIDDERSVMRDIRDKEARLEDLVDSLEETRANTLRQIGREELLYDQAKEKRMREEGDLVKLKREKLNLEKLLANEYEDKQEQLELLEEKINEQSSTLQSITNARGMLNKERDKLSFEKLRVKVFAEKNNINVDL